MIGQLVDCFFNWLIVCLFDWLIDSLIKGYFIHPAWVGSLAFALSHFFGILSGKLAQRFGCQPLAICGACVLAAGFALTTQAPNIPVMYVTYSNVSALGGSFVWTATYNIVPKYFHKRRNLAVGVMVAGPGTGVIVMDPLIQVFVEY